MVPDSPASARFLSQDEKIIAVKRVAGNRVSRSPKVEPCRQLTQAVHRQGPRTLSSRSSKRMRLSETPSQSSAPSYRGQTLKPAQNVHLVHRFDCRANPRESSLSSLLNSVDPDGSQNGVVSNFSSIIISGFGFSKLQTTLLDIPNSVLQIASLVLSGYLSGRFRNSRAIMMVCDHHSPAMHG